MEADKSDLAALRRAAQIYQNDGQHVDQWYYEGDNGEVMGPFPAKWLMSWVLKGALSSKKEVSSIPNGKAHSICDLWGSDFSLFEEGEGTTDLVHAQELVLAQIEKSEKG
jgi:hypothetical protein